MTYCIENTIYVLRQNGSLIVGLINLHEQVTAVDLELLLITHFSKFAFHKKSKNAAATYQLART